MAEITKAEYAVLSDLPAALQKCMRSKPTLAILSALDARGFISFDPFGCECKITELGKNVEAQHKARLDRS